METLHLQDHRAEIHKVVVGPLDNNVFVLRCRHTGEAVLIDAADEPDRLLPMCRELGVRSVLQTHGHHDHIQAVPAVRRAGYQVAVSPADAFMLEGRDKWAGHDTVIEEGSVLAMGRLRLEVLATPGHTPGSLCFRLAGSPVLFSGDTLFPGGPGATGGDPGRFATIIDQISDKLLVLDPETVVLPGHGPDTTIGAERPHLTEWVARGW